MQVAARSPAMAAMQLGTLDMLAGGGRVIGGLGVSGPQIVEGWYGAPWGDPKERLRDYTLIMKMIFARQGPVVYEGKEPQLPYKGSGSIGMGKALKSILEFEHIPEIWHGTGARNTVTMTAEVADGWLPIFFLPQRDIAVGIALMLVLGLLTGFLPALAATRLRIVDALRRG